MKKKNLMTKHLLAAAAGKRPIEGEPEITNMMLDARYLRQSSALIQEALQKGFDVLQLANGDIVTTGTKTVVLQYAWDDSKGKLVKAKTDKKARRASEEEGAEENELENEDA
ncbi:MAG: DUF2671 domain-containing protein [Alphaproteobacteria bacterium]|nr:DUF2671 domain-containing protein [Alphaproteobacteria bacterium]